MCVAALAWNAHPDWQLVAVGNRDEYHERPAAPLARWNDGSGVIAGRDLRSGGTWLGVSGRGFVLVTNLRGYGDPDPAKASRGQLVSGLLSGTGPYADPDTAPLDGFNPLNLLHCRDGEARFLTNRPEPARAHLPHGIYGLSNGALDEPWPKTLRLKAALTDWLAADSTDFEALFVALARDTLDDVGLHPRQPSDVPAEAAETPVFIRNALYGTRCSTVVAVNRAGQGVITERSFAADGSVAGRDRSERFAWEPAPPLAIGAPAP
ncbi:MAG: NRDE family protein [Novosphingobium sp.]|nr:NRDE family protein [Novosphingobium sp.]